MLNWLRNLFRRDPIKVEVTIHVPTIHVVAAQPEGSARPQCADVGPRTSGPEGSVGPADGSLHSEHALDNFKKRLGDIPTTEGDFGKERPTT
jgi:hypothetical protein